MEKRRLLIGLLLGLGLGFLVSCAPLKPRVEYVPTPVIVTPEAPCSGWVDWLNDEQELYPEGFAATNRRQEGRL